MHIDQRKEQFSLAYVHAVAAVAGCKVAHWSVDDDSVDVTLARKREAAAFTAPKLDVQMKCTHLEDWDEHGMLRYPLKIKNYEDLRDPHVLIPRILVVVVVPSEIELWCGQTEAEMTLRKCGYWLSLAGLAATTNDQKVTVYLPRVNMFTPRALDQMMRVISTTGRL